MRPASNEELYNSLKKAFGQIQDLAGDIATLNETVTNQENVIAALPGSASPIVNAIRNSDWNYSTLAYTGAGSATEAAHWYKHFHFRLTDGVVVATTNLQSATGLFTVAVFAYGTIRAVVYGAKADGSTLSVTLTRVSDTSVTMSAAADVTASNLEVWFGEELQEAAAQALETTATTFGQWSKATSTALIGGSASDERFSIDQPLVGNPCTPSSRQYFQMITELVTGTKTTDLSMYVGIWDATAGQQKWLEGTNFDLMASKVGPHTGGATSRTYRIIATTDYGYKLQSDDATVTNTVNPLTTTSYISLSWTNLVGVLTYDIYMYDGTNYWLVTTINNGSFTFLDDGTGARLDTGFPSITATKWRAFVEIPPSGFSPLVDSWSLVRATLAVPNTYDSSVTTGKQWIRMGLTKNTTDLVLRIDHSALCSAPGTAWVKSAMDDNAVSLPDGLPTSGTQGPTGGGPGPIFPPGQGGTVCIFEDEPVSTPDGDLFWPKIKVGMLVNDGFGNYQPITKINRVYQHSTTIITTSDGATLRSSLTHPFIQSAGDFIGKTAFGLDIGETVLTSDDDNNVQSVEVVSKESGGAGWVLEISMNPSNPRFMAGAGKRKCISRNTKQVGNEL